MNLSPNSMKTGMQLVPASVPELWQLPKQPDGSLQTAPIINDALKKDQGKHVSTDTMTNSSKTCAKNTPKFYWLLENLLRTDDRIVEDHTRKIINGTHRTHSWNEPILARFTSYWADWLTKKCRSSGIYHASKSFLPSSALGFEHNDFSRVYFNQISC